MVIQDQDLLKVISGAVGPAAGHEELWELVQLEVRVEEDHRVVGRLDLVEDERGLGGDHLEAELLGALGHVRAEGVARQQRRLAADADARA